LPALRPAFDAAAAEFRQTLLSSATISRFQALFAELIIFIFSPFSLPLFCFLSRLTLPPCH